MFPINGVDGMMIKAKQNPGNSTRYQVETVWLAFNLAF